MSQIDRARVAAALIVCAAVSSAHPGAQQAVPPMPAQGSPATLPAPQQSPPTVRPGIVGTAQAPSAPPASRRGVAPQGFSVVLVLGDLQGASAADDVPLAARKALTDMRDFLPFKSYRLLDAAWLMCCGEQRGGGGSTNESLARNIATQMLRGPDEQEYELRLSTSRGEAARVFVRFTLIGGAGEGAGGGSAAANAASVRTAQRRIADLEDRLELQQKLIHEARRKAEVGVAPPTEIPKMEVEQRSLEREIQDLRARAAAGVAATRSGQRSNSSERMLRGPVIDTSFSMDVGETVVVGTSRLKGGTRALIALLTAVPPRR